MKLWGGRFKTKGDFGKSFKQHIINFLLLLLINSLPQDATNDNSADKFQIRELCELTSGVNNNINITEQMQPPGIF